MIALAADRVTLLAPWGLALGAAAVGGLVLLHAITVGRPRPAWLPTARFAPDRAPRATRRLARPTDRRLLALRATSALLAGVALARPVREPVRQHVARVVIADIGDAATRPAVRDGVRALAGPGDVVVPLAGVPRRPLDVPTRPPASAADSVARLAALDSALADSAPSSDPSVHPSRGQSAAAPLSAALIAARRAAPGAAAVADSVELVIVSPLARDAVDA
ncbi:MAG TPA: BatA domain-containing protein, partial [Gemmatirosa sp.]